MFFKDFGKIEPKVAPGNVFLITVLFFGVLVYFGINTLIVSKKDRERAYTARRGSALRISYAAT